MGTGQANAKAYDRQLCGLIEQGKSKPSWFVFQELSLDQAPQADRHFDHREDGWTEVSSTSMAAERRQRGPEPVPADNRKEYAP
ncbi:hypothetical protein [Streptomyces sp. NPDC056844]|uniref:hypothetical protein n=1 Tax=unclassified Streptomyces TaxID=2593676 RepID=UPI0036C5408B